MSSSPSIDDLVAALKSLIAEIRGSKAATAAGAAATAIVNDSIDGLNSLTGTTTGETQLQTQPYLADANGNVAVKIAAKGFLLWSAGEALTFVLDTGQLVQLGVGQGWRNDNYTFTVRQITGAQPGEKIWVTWGDSLPTSFNNFEIREFPVPDQADPLNSSANPWLDFEPVNSTPSAARTGTLSQALAVGEARGGRTRVISSGSATIASVTAGVGGDTFVYFGNTAGSAPQNNAVYRLRKLTISDPDGGLSSGFQIIGVKTYAAGTPQLANPAPLITGQVPLSAYSGDCNCSMYDPTAIVPSPPTITSAPLPVFLGATQPLPGLPLCLEWGPEEGPVFGGTDWTSQGAALPIGLAIQAFPSAENFDPNVTFAVSADFDLCVDDAAGNMANGEIWLG